MSEQGWQDFLSAEGVNDWVVLHGGATAAFRVGSLSRAARLALTTPSRRDELGQALARQCARSGSEGKLSRCAFMTSIAS